MYKNKASSTCKGIRYLVNIKSCSKRDIRIMEDNGSKISDPTKIANLFNEYFVTIGPNIESEISNSKNDYRDFLKNIKLNKGFSYFLLHMKKYLTS